MTVESSNFLFVYLILTPRSSKEWVILLSGVNVGSLTSGDLFFSKEASVLYVINYLAVNDFSLDVSTVYLIIFLRTPLSFVVNT
jgi:hypothetical protein